MAVSNVRLTNAVGERVYEENLGNIKGEVLEIPLNRFSSGIYFLSVFQDDLVTMKFVIAGK